MKPKDMPNDATGDALRRLASHGSDLEKSMLVDFHVAAPTEAAAQAIARDARPLGFVTQVYQTDDDWTCKCSLETVATYDVISALEAKLDRLARPHRGHVDGFGSFGNAPSS
jgi:hypothetical protein